MKKQNDKSKKNSYKKKKNPIVENYNLSLYEFTRWAALLEAVEIIGNKCDERGIDFGNSELIKPKAIVNYVDNRTDTLMEKIKTSKEHENRLSQQKIDKIKQHLEEALQIKDI